MDLNSLSPQSCRSAQTFPIITHFKAFRTSTAASFSETMATVITCQQEDAIHLRPKGRSLLARKKMTRFQSVGKQGCKDTLPMTSTF